MCVNVALDQYCDGRRCKLVRGCRRELLLYVHSRVPRGIERTAGWRAGRGLRAGSQGHSAPLVKSVSLGEGRCQC